MSGTVINSQKNCQGPSLTGIKTVRTVKNSTPPCFSLPWAGPGRGAAQAPQARGARGAAPRGVGRGDGRGRLNPRRQVHKVTDDPKFEEVNEDPFEEYLTDLDNQDF